MGREETEENWQKKWAEESYIHGRNVVLSSYIDLK